MASSRERRVAKELQDIQADRDKSGIMVELVNQSDLTHLRGSFSGPPDSPYEGGTYVVDIKIPDNYPFKSPAMKFITKIWHPNVSSVTVRNPRPERPAASTQGEGTAELHRRSLYRNAVFANDDLFSRAPSASTPSEAAGHPSEPSRPRSSRCACFSSRPTPRIPRTPKLPG